MKMTIEIPEDVLAEVMALTGCKTKREAVEASLRETARRAKQSRIWGEGLGHLTPEEWAAEAAPKPSDLLDAPDIDEAAVKRFFANADARQAKREAFLKSFELNEPPPPPYGAES